MSLKVALSIIKRSEEGIHKQKVIALNMLNAFDYNKELKARRDLHEHD